MRTRDKLTQIRITEKTRDKIAALAKKKGLRQVTVLEYLLSGEINLKELCQ